MSGGNMYPGSAVAHPTNDLQEIFQRRPRAGYQFVPRNAINSIRDLPNAGAQLSISAGLLENYGSRSSQKSVGLHTWLDECL